MQPLQSEAEETADADHQNKPKVGGANVGCASQRPLDCGVVEAAVQDEQHKRCDDVGGAKATLRHRGARQIREALRRAHLRRSVRVRVRVRVRARGVCVCVCVCRVPLRVRARGRGCGHRAAMGWRWRGACL